MAKKKRKIIKSNENRQLSAVINVLEKVSQTEFISNSELFSDDFCKIIERLKDDSFRLAVVGEFSSGKSTFLNALIGRDLLKHGAQETTATVTEIHNDSLQNGETLLDVYYMNGNIKRDISSSEITEFTATASKSHLVAQEIEKVVVKSKILDNNAEVCFVDTPGLNGIADNHREKTIEQIKNAHACIYLMQVRGLGQSDIEFLKYICKYQHNIIFVQNFIDELKKLEGETPEEKIVEQKRIIQEKILVSEPNVKYRIVAVSARKALISKSDEFSSYNDEILTEELRDQLYEESRFDEVFKVINELMTDNEKEKTKVKDAVAVAINLLEQLKKVVTFENGKEREEWEHSIEGINKKNYEQLIESLKNNRDMYQKKIDDYIEAETSDIRKECNREVTSGLENIENKIKDILSSIIEIDEFEKYVAESLSSYLYSEISDIEDNSNRQMNLKFENLICNAVLRIKQYTGTNASDIDLSGFKTKTANANIQNLTKEESEITQLQENIAEKRLLDEKYRQEVSVKVAEKSKLDIELVENTSKLSTTQNMKSSEINRLGSMPEKETKYKEEIYYEYRGGLGIVDFFLGPERKTRSIPYSDETNQQRWKKKKSDIETKYREQENQINAQSRMLEAKKRQCDEDLRHIEHTETSRQKDIKSMESFLASKIEYLTVQREKVKQEYLREAKKGIHENVRQYLYENIHELFVDNFEEAVTENKNRVSKIINSLFDLSYEERIRSLETLVNENSVTKGLEDTEQLLRIINQSTKELEVFICQN